MDTHLQVEDKIVAALRRIIRAVDLHSRRLSESCGMTWPQLATLREAARLEAGSVSAIARSVHLSQPTVTGIVDRLARTGLVTRACAGKDRRAVLVTVTPLGHERLNCALSLLQDRFRRELSAVQEWEQSQILATLQRIAAMMDAEALEASPVLYSGTLEPAVLQPPTDVQVGPGVETILQENSNDE